MQLVAKTWCINQYMKNSNTPYIVKLSVLLALRACVYDNFEYVKSIPSLSKKTYYTEIIPDLGKRRLYMHTKQTGFAIRLLSLDIKCVPTLIQPLSSVNRFWKRYKSRCSK